MPTTRLVTSAADSGAGSLRSVLTQAQAGDTIQFASTLAGKTIRLTSGQLAIQKNLTIDATGVSNLTVSGNNASRIFAVGASISASFKNLTLTEGKTTEGGGGIVVGRAGRLMVENCRFNNNKAGIGGAIRLNYEAKATILNSSFDNNDGTSAKSGFSAGAIATNGSGELIVKGSRFTNNRGINGGAIYNLLGPVRIEDSVFLNNSSSGNIGGGAVFTDGGNPIGPSTTQGGSIVVRGSWFEGNQTKGEGGALFLYGYKDKILLENSTVINNFADVDSKGVGRGGGLRANSELTIRNVTFANNRATVQGGGIWLDGNLPVNIINSTFSGNQATRDAGGAMFLKNGASVNLLNSTVADNFAGRASGAIWTNSTSAQLTKLINSIVANNSAGDPMQKQVNYRLQDGGGNIEFPGPTIGKRVVAKSLIADPKLGALQNIGGVWVRPLLSGSPAINAATSAAPATDQRGVTREGAPDIGAFEAVARLLLATRSNTNTSVAATQTNITETTATKSLRSSESTEANLVLNDVVDNVLNGDRENNKLRGGIGVDQIFGNAGNDVIIGGLGNDILVCGEGSDRFVYHRLSDGMDVIEDFDVQQDQIDLRPIFRNAGIAPKKQWSEYIKAETSDLGMVLQIDIGSDDNHNSLRKLVTLGNVKVGSLAAENFLL